jgi:serine/threonine-protein kinase
LGLLLYELFTGKRAFEGKSLADYKRMQQHENPVAPCDLLDLVDPAVEAIILRCIEKDPDDRPASAREVVQALPGGDPLADALAGGHTPAPELVAAAGSSSSPTVPAVTGLFAVWLALLAGLLALAPSDRGRALIAPGEKPTAVLRDRVATLLTEIGYRTPPVDTGDWYSMDTSARDAPFAGPIDELPAPLVYNYRQSPGILHRAGMGLTMEDPAPSVPGMVALRMDATGRLLQLSAVPGGLDDPAHGSTPVPDHAWDRLFEAAGLDRSTFVAADTVDFVPPVHSTERHAWSRSTDGEPAWNVEAAGASGLPVSFAVHAPSIAPGSMAIGGMAPPPDTDALVAMLLLGVMGLLAWRNLRLGRGDRRGAWAVAAFVFVTHVILWLGVQDHPGSLGAWFFTLIGGLGYDLFLAVTAYVCFLALEPVARRRWPTAMISWTRLLQGRWLDPLVGRDALAGGTLTFAVIIVLTGADRALQAMGFDGAVPRRTALGLESVHASLAVTIHDAGDAVVGALLIVLMLVLIRSVVRLPSMFALLSAAGFALIMGFDAGYPAYDVFRDAGLGLLMCWLLTHYGILSVLVSVFIVTSTGADLLPAINGWDGHVTLVRASVLAALGLWAWRAALAGRPVLPSLPVIANATRKSYRSGRTARR